MKRRTRWRHSEKEQLELRPVLSRVFLPILPILLANIPNVHPKFGANRGRKNQQNNYLQIDPILSSLFCRYLPIFGTSAHPFWCQSQKDKNDCSTSGLIFVNDWIVPILVLCVNLVHLGQGYSLDFAIWAQIFKIGKYILDRKALRSFPSIRFSFNFSADSDGRTYQVSNVGLLLAEYTTGGVYLQRYFLLRVNKLTQVRALYARVNIFYIRQICWNKLGVGFSYHADITFKPLTLILSVQLARIIYINILFMILFIFCFLTILGAYGITRTVKLTVWYGNIKHWISFLITTSTGTRTGTCTLGSRNQRSFLALLSHHAFLSSSAHWGWLSIRSQWLDLLSLPASETQSPTFFGNLYFQQGYDHHKKK